MIYNLNEFKKDIILERNSEEERILKLQQQFINGNIDENNISDEDYFKLVELFKKQNNEIEERIESRKKSIRKRLNDMKES